MSLSPLGAMFEGIASGKRAKDARNREREIMDMRREDLAIRRMEVESGRAAGGGRDIYGADASGEMMAQRGPARPGANAPPGLRRGGTSFVGGEPPAPMAGSPDWLRYSNANAVRRHPLSEKMVGALNSFLPEMGLTMEVFSGGQPAAGGGPRVGSTRHDHGEAADVFFYKDGRRLNWADPADQETFAQIVQRARHAGLTGFGAGDGYMRPGSMHIGYGNPGAWGAGGSGSNAPDWLRTAFNTPWSPPAAAPAAQTTTGAAAAAAPVAEAPPAGRRMDDRAPRSVLSFGDEVLKRVKG